MNPHDAKELSLLDHTPRLAWWGGWLSIAVGVMHCLARFATDAGQEDLTDLTLAWADPARRLLDPLLSFADADHVHVLGPRIAVPSVRSRRLGALTDTVGDNGPMTDLKATLQADLTEAIRGRDEVTAATVRMALAAVTTEEVSGKAARTLTEQEVVGVLTKEAKKRREAAAAFSDAGRTELADREEAELAVLARYLPEPLTEDEVTTMVAEAVASAAQSGVTGMPAMGRIMKELTPRTAGRFDGGRLAALVRAALS
jgi:uncharacterized protein YqeY